MPSLDVFLYGAHVAMLELLAPLQYRLTYRAQWLDDPNQMPVSLSLPVGAAPITGPKLTSFLDNLLPDNADVRERWAVQAGLATAEPFELLRAYGTDVAGAIQFAEPGTDPNQQSNSASNPISNAEIAARIRAIREDDTSWQDSARNTGSFSLGGAQGKFSLGNAGTGWYEPTGSHPTTHIFKPRVRGQKDGELVEFVAMTVARIIGIDTAGVHLSLFDGEHTLVVERFDRLAIGAGSGSGSAAILRIHQEDLAQASGVTRLQKYESRGGPSYRDVLRLLDTHVSDEHKESSKLTFVQALVFSWMALNTDAHAKNYSVFIRPDGAALTPLYDVSSFIPYAGRADDDHHRTGAAFRNTNLSMRIAADYEAGKHSWFEWGAVAREAGLSRVLVTDWASAVADSLPELIAEAASMLPSHLQTDTIARLVERTPIRAAQVVAAIAR
ncbi:type II toxin-antitoxin system HipA family toxin [Cryobacterium frigoriphilum]|uniref:Type II toxin-antitoxin system HipA family toxin n=1 Tax=Cryobacterium frigoriphilum TaxID=1259150 RepID=A0A4R8ZZU2_9MICO|nr:HipA domain-containing protein [Cryobacterium frigoriphilum]TFD49574.1 type II toxin-antitoxin system HipA family toxin [Cryobacterium frigoriphilum]